MFWEFAANKPSTIHYQWSIWPSGGGKWSHCRPPGLHCSIYTNVSFVSGLISLMTVFPCNDLFQTRMTLIKGPQEVTRCCYSTRDGRNTSDDVFPINSTPPLKDRTFVFPFQSICTNPNAAYRITRKFFLFR